MALSIGDEKNGMMLGFSSDRGWHLGQPRRKLETRLAYVVLFFMTCIT